MSFFDKAKSQVLTKPDESRKGSWDEAIDEFMNKLNTHPDLLTLSSCSGRIVIYRDKSIAQQNGVVKKKGCDWIKVTHQQLENDELWNILEEEELHKLEGCIKIKFEPFILHIQCRTIELAKKLHTISLESGFKNTGLTIGKNEKFVLAVRSSHGIEAPLTDLQGNILVNDSYCQFITSQVNEKMHFNELKHKKLFDNCLIKIF